MSIPFNTDPYEIEVPVQHVTFEAQVLVVTKPYKKMVYPLLGDLSDYDPLSLVKCVMKSGNYLLTLVPSAIANGKPMLMVTEEEEKEAKEGE